VVTVAQVRGNAAPPALDGLHVITPLGAGGFGSVWEAIRASDGLTVAIKVAHGADPTIRERFRREASALLRVGPPHVPELYHAGQLADGRPYLVMERLWGETLAAHLEELAVSPPFGELRRLADAVLESVAAVHGRDVIHRDLKPENIFLSGSPLTARVMDFGLTKDLDPVDGASKTRTGVVMGTPEYMAPEQLRASTDIDGRADIYALGIILYELATLRLPFAGDRAAIEQGHLTMRPPRPSEFADVPPPLEEVVLRCLAKAADRRFASVDELRLALDQALDAVGDRPRTAAPRPTGAEPPSDPASAASRLKTALVFLHAPPQADHTVRTLLGSTGGHLAHVASDQYVGAFSPQDGTHPLRRALAVAQLLVQRQVCAQVMVDLGVIAQKRRPDGSPRFISGLFTQRHRYPQPEDPSGVMLTAAAREVLGDVPVVPVPGREGVQLVREEGGPQVRVATILSHARGPLVGRDSVLQVLCQSVRRAALEQHPTIATVLGEPGLGKTHLFAALIQRLSGEVPHLRIIEVRAREPVTGDTDQVLRELLVTVLAVPRQLESVAIGRALLTERLGPELASEVFGGIALILGWVPPDHASVRNLRAAPGVLRQTVSRALGEGLRALASERPLCVVLDDAQWADYAALDALEYAAAAGSDLPIWVGVFARPAFERSRPTWGERAAARTTERLGPLDRGSAAELCRRLLLPAEDVADSVIERLLERSRRVPLLLVDLLSGLKRDGLVRHRPGGSGYYLATELLDELPDLPLLEWLAGREVAALPTDLHALVRLLSLLGAEFAADECEGVIAALERSGAGRELRVDARVGLARLQSSGLVVQHRGHGYGFRNSLMRDVVAATVTEPLRSQIHRAALEYYRRADQLASDRRLARLAWHAGSIGERAEAAAAYLELAHGARGRHAYLDAALLYDRALAQLDQDDRARRLIALKGRGIMRYRMARYEDSLADLLAARELAQGLNDRAALADVLLDAAMALDWLGEYHEAQARTAEAQTIIAGLRSPLLAARLLQAQGRSASRFNRDEECVELLLRATALAETLGDDSYEVLVTSYLHLAFALPLVGRIEEAQAACARALAVSQARSDELHLMALYQNRACLWIALDDKERMLADTEQALARARRLGLRNSVRQAEQNLGTYLYWRGEHDAAEPHVRRMVELDDERLRSEVRPDGRVLLARLLWARGNQTGAQALVDELCRHQEQQRAAGKTEALLFPNDELLLEVLRLATGGGDDAAWEAALARARTTAQGQELIEVLEVRGLCAERAGDLETARAVWQDALAIGERIPNVFGPRLRRRLQALDAAR
jgi:serine/threonine protein kinase/tetratricopeptide (TPR) repeat protein